MRLQNIFKFLIYKIIHLIKVLIKKLIHLFIKPNLPIKLYKMLIRSTAYWFFIAQSLFIVIYLIFDFFTKIDKYINNSVSTFNILYISALLIPKAMWLTMPVAIMFGIIMAIASFYQNNELIAIFTSGISIYKFVYPLTLICLFLSLFMIFFDSFVVIPTYRYRENLFEHITKTEKTERNITIRGEKDDSFFWTVQEYIPNNNMLKNVLIFKLNYNFKIIYRIDAASAIYTKEGWLFRNGIIREWADNGELKYEKKIYKTVLNNLIETPKIFKNVFNKSDYDIEKMTIPEAKKRINLLKSLNIEHNEELRDYYKKFSFPFTLLIVCLFAIGVSTLSQKNILILSLFFSIGLAILYYIAQMILDIMAKNGQIIPLIAAWSPLLIFLPIAIYMVKKAKT